MGYTMGYPSHSWDQIQKESKHKEFYLNRTVKVGHKKRKREATNVKRKAKKFLDDSHENLHFARVRRQDLIQLAKSSGWISPEEYDIYAILNQNPKEEGKGKHEDLQLFQFGDFLSTMEKLVVWYCKCEWPTTKKEYKARDEVKEYYKENNLDFKNITLLPHIDERKRVAVIEKHGRRPKQ